MILFFKKNVTEASRKGGVGDENFLLLGSDQKRYLSLLKISFVGFEASRHRHEGGGRRPKIERHVIYVASLKYVHTKTRLIFHELTHQNTKIVTPLLIPNV